MSDKSYAEYLAEDAAHHARLMDKYGVGPVPRTYKGDTSLLNSEPVVIEPSHSLARKAEVEQHTRPVLEPVQLSLLAV